MLLARHPAENWTYQLYMELKARAEPIAVPHFSLDTGQLAVDVCVERCLGYLNGGRINS